MAISFAYQLAYRKQYCDYRCIYGTGKVQSLHSNCKGIPLGVEERLKAKIPEGTYHNYVILYGESFCSLCVFGYINGIGHVTMNKKTMFSCI